MVMSALGSRDFHLHPEFAHLAQRVQIVLLGVIAVERVDIFIGNDVNTRDGDVVVIVICRLADGVPISAHPFRVVELLIVDGRQHDNGGHTRPPVTAIDFETIFCCADEAPEEQQRNAWNMHGKTPWDELRIAGVNDSV